tara:strand:- start:1471 stop:1602 length:132 start_codon:yes stop_codon:yes gene_type:complete
MEENQETKFDEKAAEADSKIDAFVAVIIMLTITAMVVFWVASQ